ncbi:hypothetical protein AC578_10876 [Pseudocercospora eumusae]|uniref:Uncharacterized protein n=1 Tax=Pseudocercospora eumusae TaxID=321146 RepID=A0A139H8U9_9PEZI|nr:hypothetical protein AC578_10876 [Pseudocercospora eumusae]
MSQHKPLDTILGLANGNCMANPSRSPPSEPSTENSAELASPPPYAIPICIAPTQKQLRMGENNSRHFMRAFEDVLPSNKIFGGQRNIAVGAAQDQNLCRNQETYGLGRTRLRTAIT